MFAKHMVYVLSIILTAGVVMVAVGLVFVPSGSSSISSPLVLTMVMTPNRTTQKNQTGFAMEIMCGVFFMVGENSFLLPKSYSSLNGS